MFFPQPSWLIDAIHQRIRPLEGWVPATNQTLEELARRSKLGV
jgi:2-oxoisovalerate dehydrogenase E1 component